MRPNRPVGAGTAGDVRPATGLALHRRGRLFRLGIKRIPTSEALRSGRKPSLPAGDRRRSVRTAYPPGERAVADRLRPLQGPGLGLVPWTASWAGYLSTVLDDYSRHILAWKLTPTMAATDVQETLEIALAEAKLDRFRVRHRPRLLSDNGPCYVSGELRQFLEAQGMDHTRGAPYHPKAPGTPGVTQGKIERYHRSMKNLIQLQNYAFPRDLEQEIGRFMNYYNHQRYQESLDNVAPAFVYFGRAKDVLTRQEEIKRQTPEARRRQDTQSLQLAV